MIRRAVSDDDLDLVETDQLLRALGRRYEVWVFPAAREKATEADGTQILSMRTSHNGDHLRLIGLCHYLADELSWEMQKDFVPSEDDEP